VIGGPRAVGGLGPVGGGKRPTAGALRRGVGSIPAVAAGARRDGGSA
jgi:hypothetical protein